MFSSYAAFSLLFGINPSKKEKSDKLAVHLYGAKPNLISPAHINQNILD
jgi:hypothetical protein